MGILREVMDARWGIHLVPEFSPKVIVATTTAQKVLDDYADRLSILFVNLGDQVAYVHAGADVSSSKGIYLDKNGGFISMNWEVEGELVGLEWWLVSIADTNIYLISMVGSR